MEEWIEGLSTFVRGTAEEQMMCESVTVSVVSLVSMEINDTLCLCLVAFVVYDLNGDGYISKEEMFPMLKACMIKVSTEEDPDEGVKDLLDLVLKKMVICVPVASPPMAL